MQHITTPDGTFFKVMDSHLCGKNGYQYTVGGIFEPSASPNDGPWRWLYFSDSLSSSVVFSNDPHPRVCLVRPLGETWKERSHMYWYNRSCHYSTDRLEIVRELSHEEIIGVLREENCPMWLALRFDPSFDMLCGWKDAKENRVMYREHVMGRKDLSESEKEELLLLR